jgi:hypothetical protein
MVRIHLPLRPTLVADGNRVESGGDVGEREWWMGTQWGWRPGHAKALGYVRLNLLACKVGRMLSAALTTSVIPGGGVLRTRQLPRS